MSEIKSSIMAVAREAVFAAYMADGHYGQDSLDLVLRGNYDNSAEVQAAARAIIKERARCAAVARSRVNMYGEPNAERDGAALSIAHGIESGESPK